MRHKNAGRENAGKENTAKNSWAGKCETSQYGKRTDVFRPPGTTVPDGLLFYRICFFRQPHLQGPSADRRETLPHDRNLAQKKQKIPKFGGRSPKKYWGPKHAKFRSIFGNVRLRLRISFLFPLFPFLHCPPSAALCRIFYSSRATFLKVPSHHNVLASARLAFNKFHKKNAKRSNLQRSPNVYMAIGVSPALTNAWETF